MWLHILLVFGGMIVGAFIGCTIGVVGFGALLAARKSEVPVPQLEIPEDWREREQTLRQQ